MDILERQRSGLVDERLMRLGKPKLAISAAQDSYLSNITFITKESDRNNITPSTTVITERPNTNCRNLIHTPLHLYNAYHNKNNQRVKLEQIKNIQSYKTTNFNKKK